MSEKRKSCSELSIESGEQLFGTAPRVDNWFLLEYSGHWNKDALVDSTLSSEVKDCINKLLDSFPNSRLQLIKKDGNSSENISFYYAKSTEFEPKLYKFSLNNHEDIINLDIKNLIETGEIRDSESDEKIVLICTHGAYDTCCGKLGVPVYNNINENKDVSVWNSTHVGAHRFSANLVTLPEGIYYGRVNTENVGLLIESHLKEEIYLDCFRGRSCYSQTSQVSDYFLRDKIGKLGIYDIEWEYEKDRDSYTNVEFKVPSNNLMYGVSTVVLNDAIKVLPNCANDNPKYLPLFLFYSLIPYEPEEENEPVEK